MKNFKWIFVLVILISCSKPKLGEIGNYQVELENSKADIHVLMWEQKFKTKIKRTYASYSNSNIHYTRGTITGKPLHGKYKEVSESGALLVSGSFKKGLRNGYWSYYNDEGDLESDLTYKNGDTITAVNFYSQDGKVKDQFVPAKIKKKINKRNARKEKCSLKKEKCKAGCTLFKKKDNVTPSDSTSVK